MLAAEHLSTVQPAPAAALLAIAAATADLEPAFGRLAVRGIHPTATDGWADALLAQLRASLQVAERAVDRGESPRVWLDLAAVVAGCPYLDEEAA